MIEAQVFENIRLFDGAQILPAQTVLVQDGIIRAVGRVVSLPPGVRRIDGQGTTLLPGLIDAHTHTWTCEGVRGALAAATSVPAMVFGLRDRGCIAPGLRADLVQVAGNPLDDIRATRQIVGIWKQGIQVDRNRYAAYVQALQSEDEQREAPDGDLVIAFTRQTTRACFGSGWELVSDNAYSGGSTVRYAFVPGGVNGNPASLQVTGELLLVSPLLPAVAGICFSTGREPGSPTNLSGRAGISF